MCEVLFLINNCNRIENIFAVEHFLLQFEEIIVILQML